MNFAGPSSSALLATCGGETVKLFDVTVTSGDPCILSYSPSPKSQVNCARWNHTNLVVASAGDDNKISLWHKNGQTMGTIPLSGSEIADNIEESISSISFSNKGSRYLCSGGSGHIVRIWDLQRKRCIKWLSGHTDTITGVMYNCKDEHLASVSIKGDIIIHNLASGARAAELNDPNEQALRVLDYSRLSRHVLVTSGDDGSLHLWDTTGRSPKISWLKQHSAPTTGLCFSPSSDKIIASVGLDKKLYTFDSGTKRPTSCTPYDTPFSSLAYNDDGNILAAGTNSGRIVFYDVRGKPQPLTVLRAYNTSEAVISICWQRSKPVIVSENYCTDEMALLGGSSDDSVLMPDPMPSVSTSSLPSTAAEETPNHSRLWPGGSLSKLHAPRPSYNPKDDMDVFSPLVDVQPITPSLGNWWDDLDEARKVSAKMDKKPSLFASSSRRFPFTESMADTLPYTATSVSSSKSDSSPASATPPEAWRGNPVSEKLTLSRFLPPVSLAPGSIFSGSQDPSLASSHSDKNSLTNFGLSSINLQSTASSEFMSVLSSTSVPFETKTIASSALPRKYSTYAERMSAASSFSDVIGSAVGSPKSKKTGSETKEELINSILSRQGTSSATGIGSIPAINGMTSQLPRMLDQPVDQQQGSSFSLQLVQRTLEETLGSMQKSIHEDVRNLHIDLLRQFHMQEMEMSSMLTGVLEKQDELLKEVQSLRRENQQLRRLL